MKADEAKIEEMVQACRKAGELGLISYSSGNMSYRLDGERFAVTGTGTWLADTTREQVSLCKLEDCTRLEGCQESVECDFHARVLRKRPDANIVFHCQTPAATIISCGEPEGINFNVIPEVPFYIGEPGVVPYLNPGTAELAKAVEKASASHDMILLKNHGQVVIAKDFKSMFQKAGFFELACKIIISGRKISPLPAADVKLLSDRRKSRI